MFVAPSIIATSEAARADKRLCRVQSTLPLELNSSFYTFRSAPCVAKFCRVQSTLPGRQKTGDNRD